MDIPEIIKDEKEEIKAEECCPKFHPEKWDEKTLVWDQKQFITESVPELFHIPYPPMIGKKVTKMMKLAEDANRLAEDKEDTLLLFIDPNPFKSDLYLSVTGYVPEANNATLSGTFITKVFDGAYKAIPGFMKEMDSYLKEKNKKADKYYVHYACCPKCAEREGHNYMVFFAHIDDRVN